MLRPDFVLSHCIELHEHTATDDEMRKIIKDHGVAIASTLVNEFGMAHGNPPTFEAVD